MIRKLKKNWKYYPKSSDNPFLEGCLFQSFKNEKKNMSRWIFYPCGVYIKDLGRLKKVKVKLFFANFITNYNLTKKKFFLGFKKFSKCPEKFEKKNKV